MKALFNFKERFIMNIGKIRGVIFCMFIVGVYYKIILPWVHFKHFDFYPEYGFWTEVIFYGLILTQVVMMRPGEKVQLTFAGVPVESFWRGFGFLPNILHFTVFLGGSALFWGLARLKSDKYTYEEHRDVHLNVSDSNTKYNVNSTLPHWAAQLSRIVGVILEFLFVRWTRAPQEYKLSALGYSMYAIGVIMVCLNSSAILAKQKLGVVSAAVSQGVGIPEQRPQTVPAPQVQPDQRQPAAPPAMQDFVTFSVDAANRVPFWYNSTYYNLLEHKRPRVIPDPRWFSKETIGGVGRTTDGIFYVQVGKYEQGDGVRSINVAGQANCVIVPKTSTAVIYATSPPKFVINMGDEVLVGLKLRAASGIPGPDDTFWLHNMSWKLLHDSWEGRVNDMRQQGMSEVDKAHRTAFFVKGPNIDAELHPSLPTGLACF